MDNDDFLDADHQSPSHLTDHHSPPESPSSNSTLCHPDPPSPPPATTIRHRSIRPRSPVKESSDSNSTTGAIFKKDENEKFPEKPILKENEKFPEKPILKENEKFSEKPILMESEKFTDKPEVDQGKVHSFPSPSVVTEERNEESTVTTASRDDEPGDSADSVAELGDLNSNWLEYLAGLVIKTILFQIKIFIMFMKCPVLFMFYSCMFCVDPFGTMRKGKGLLIGILGRVWYCVGGYFGPSAVGWFNERNSLWNVAFRCGWGFLWSIYICCILFALLVSSLVVSGFVVRRLVEKPFQMKQVLNFDYTKQSPVAFLPIISCSDVGDENRRWFNKRVIPHKQKVLLTVSLVVPESEYNAHLGVFQIRTDVLSSNGKTIASSSQPCMLKFRSEPIRLVMTFLKIVPLLTGYISETQTLDVKMRGFVEGDIPTSCLKVTLEQRAEHLPSAGIPQIYDSSVFIESELPLFRRIIWYWKMSMFIWIAMMAFVTELLFVLVCCWPMIIPRTRQRSGSAPRGTGTRNNRHAPR